MSATNGNAVAARVEEAQRRAVSATAPRGSSVRGGGSGSPARWASVASSRETCFSAAALRAPRSRL